MYLTKSMLAAFKEIILGANTLQEIAHALRKSKSRTSELLTALEKENFVVKERQLKKVTFSVAATEHAYKLKELLSAYQTIDFAEIVGGSRLLFLAALCEDWINTKQAVELCKVSAHMIARYRRSLLNRGVILRKKKLYRLNKKAWPLLFKFIFSYKNHSALSGTVKWRFQDEILFFVNTKELVQGTTTGLIRYEDYGVKVWVISALCYLPKRKLTKEEVFVHSLFEVDDPRTLHLAMLFYLKNKLNQEKVLPLAMRYGKYTMFKDFLKLFHASDAQVKLAELPVFDRKDFHRMAEMYGVKLNRKKKKERKNVQAR